MTPVALAIALFTISLVLTLLSHKATKYSHKAVLKVAGYTLLLVLILALHYVRAIDTVSYTLSSFFTALSLLISLYTPLYAKSLRYPRELELLVDSFLYALVATYAAPNIITLISAWTFVEILGFTLIRLGEEHSLEGPLTSSRGFLLTSTATYELSVFTLVVASFFALGVNPQILLEPFTEITSRVPVHYAVLPLILLGFLTKAAITPLHFWLPSAHSVAPSPASAALSGFTVSLGFYGLYKVLGFIDVEELRGPLVLALLVLGFSSVLYGGLEALSQRDVKKLLAYGTILTNGFILAVLSLYLLTESQQALTLLLIGILTQATYKSALFCEAGLFEVLYENRYLHLLHNLAKSLPLSSIGGVVSVLSLIGVPGTIGFVAKLGYAYVALTTAAVSPLVVLAIALLALYVILSTAVGVKYMRLYYTQPQRPLLEVRTVSTLHQLPVLLLGVSSIVAAPLLFYVMGYLQLAAISALLTPLPLATTYFVVHVARTPLRGGGVTTA